MYNNSYNHNQLGQNPYGNNPCYVCPLMQNNYGYYPPAYDNFNRGNCEQNFLLEDYGYPEGEYRDFNNITMENINNITAEVKKGSPNLLKDIGKFIKDTRLLDYMLSCLIAYIAENYDRYEHIIDQKTDELVEEMKENLPWLFDILKVFNITPEMVDDFLDNLIRLTVMSIRRLAPYGL